MIIHITGPRGVGKNILLNLFDKNKYLLVDFDKEKDEILKNIINKKNIDLVDTFQKLFEKKITKYKNENKNKNIIIFGLTCNRKVNISLKPNIGIYINENPLSNLINYYKRDYLQSYFINNNKVLDNLDIDRLLTPFEYFEENNYIYNYYKNKKYYFLSQEDILRIFT
jgi:RNase adaptor protein for sRNA GlmZ degradation